MVEIKWCWRGKDTMR